MAFTGSAIVEQVSDRMVRVTGVSLAGAAEGQIVLASNPAPGSAVVMPAAFQPSAYSRGNYDVSLQASVKVTCDGAQTTIVKTGTTPENFLITIAPDLGSAGGVVYGSGDDGVAMFDGVNTFTFASLVGSTYTLTRDVFLADGSSLAVGVTLYTSGVRVFCNGTFTNAGTIHNDGKDAAANVAGGASAVGTTGVGTPGGAGHVGVGVGANGSNQQGVNTLSDAAPAGGAGGAGGADAGGIGGTYATSNTNGGANFLVPMLTGYLFTQQSGGNSASINPIGGGSGGGGGGSNNAGVNGGGGGGGGGALVFHAANLVNNGVMRAAGGNGGAAAGAGGDGGGGGGGGGGIILSLAATRSGSGTMTVPGGTGGTALAGGVAGSDGHVGHINAFSFPEPGAGATGALEIYVEFH